MSLLVSVGLVALVRRWAERRRLLDQPNDRSLHVRPTPRGGGVGIVVPVCGALACVGLLVPASRSEAWWLAGAGLLMAIVGWIDDLRGLSAGVRLVAYLCGAALVVLGVGTWPAVVWPGLLHVELAWTAAPLTVLLVAGLTNAYNFMDGTDGIAGGQGVIAGGGWLGAGLLLQDPLLTVAGTAIAGASLGFLLFNWPPASIFMGDVGSAFLGFTLAGLTVYVAPRAPAMATAGLLFVWPFVFDTTFTFLRRAWRGENLLAAHRSHLYQRLVLTGVAHRTTALVYGAYAAAGIGVGMTFLRETARLSVVGGGLIGSLAVALWLVVLWRERS
jgi:UDP-N-acetylmuramyl pentapeptide phosphotransferase/UDP-N-acetylglucosamine-1-phosphate transferase